VTLTKSNGLAPGADAPAADLEGVPDSAAMLRRVEAVAARMQEMMSESPADWRDDLTIRQLKAIYLVAGRGPISVSDLGTALAMSPASASALVKRLVKLDLLTRRESADDRRRRLLELGERGRAVLAEQREHGRRRLEFVIGRMSPSGRRALLTALDEMLQAHNQGEPQS
jgi:DNA-binding MarR family transcriptional regulator